MARFAVVGATSWGLTLAWMLERNGHDVTVLTRTDTEAAEVSARRGIARLPELRLPEGVRVASTLPKHAIEGLVVAVPAQYVRESVVRSNARRTIPILIAAKGIEFHNPGVSRRLSSVLEELGWQREKIGIISGPNLAHEVIRGLPAAAVVAAGSSAISEPWQHAISNRTFRVYTSDDVVGVEMAGALKNVIAIAAGAAWGLEFGANAVSMILTRGLAEMTRLGIAMGANPLTFQGLAGVGDLSATCFSPLSRNRRFGELVGRGVSVEEARLQIGEAIEGILTAGVAVGFGSRLNVEMPICSTVASVVGGATTIMEAMAGLLSRPLRAEATWPG